MNGAIIPAVLWYVVTFHPAIPAEPLGLTGPLPRAQCVAMARDNPGAECRAYHVKRPRR